MPSIWFYSIDGERWFPQYTPRANYLACYSEERDEALPFTMFSYFRVKRLTELKEMVR